MIAMAAETCDNGSMTKQREMRTVGTYEYFGPYLYLTAKIQTKTRLGFWWTVEKSTGAIKGHNHWAAMQQVRDMRLELAARHGYNSPLPQLVGASQ